MTRLIKGRALAAAEAAGFTVVMSWGKVPEGLTVVTFEEGMTFLAGDILAGRPNWILHTPDSAEQHNAAEEARCLAESQDYQARRNAVSNSPWRLGGHRD